MGTSPMKAGMALATRLWPERLPGGMAGHPRLKNAWRFNDLNHG